MPENPHYFTPMKKTSRIIWLLALLFSACDEDEAVPEALRLLEAFVGTVELNPQGEIAEGLPVDRSITLVFSAAVDRQSAVRAITLQHDQLVVILFECELARTDDLRSGIGNALIILQFQVGQCLDSQRRIFGYSSADIRSLIGMHGRQQRSRLLHLVNDVL